MYCLKFLEVNSDKTKIIHSVSETADAFDHRFNLNSYIKVAHKKFISVNARNPSIIGYAIYRKRPEPHKAFLQFDYIHISRYLELKSTLNKEIVEV